MAKEELPAWSHDLFQLLLILFVLYPSFVPLQSFFFFSSVTSPSHNYLSDITFILVCMVCKHEHWGQQNHSSAVTRLSHTLILFETDGLLISSTHLEYKNTLCYKKYILLVLSFCMRTCTELYYKVREGSRAIPIICIAINFAIVAWLFFSFYLTI